MLTWLQRSVNRHTAKPVLALLLALHQPPAVPLEGAAKGAAGGKRKAANAAAEANPTDGWPLEHAEKLCRLLDLLLPLCGGRHADQPAASPVHADSSAQRCDKTPKSMSLRTKAISNCQASSGDVQQPTTAGGHSPGAPEASLKDWATAWSTCVCLIGGASDQVLQQAAKKRRCGAAAGGPPDGVQAIDAGNEEKGPARGGGSSSHVPHAAIARRHPSDADAHIVGVEGARPSDACLPTAAAGDVQRAAESVAKTASSAVQEVFRAAVQAEFAASPPSNCNNSSSCSIVAVIEPLLAHLPSDMLLLSLPSPSLASSQLDQAAPPQHPAAEPKPSSNSLLVSHLAEQVCDHLLAACLLAPLQLQLPLMVGQVAPLALVTATSALPPQLAHLLGSGVSALQHLLQPLRQQPRAFTALIQQLSQACCAAVRKGAATQAVHADKAVKSAAGEATAPNAADCTPVELIKAKDIEDRGIRSASARLFLVAYEILRLLASETASALEASQTLASAVHSRLVNNSAEPYLPAAIQLLSSLVDMAAAPDVQPPSLSSTVPSRAGGNDGVTHCQGSAQHAASNPLGACSNPGENFEAELERSKLGCASADGTKEVHGHFCSAICSLFAASAAVACQGDIPDMQALKALSAVPGQLLSHYQATKPTTALPDARAPSPPRHQSPGSPQCPAEATTAEMHTSGIARCVQLVRLRLSSDLVTAAVSAAIKHPQIMRLYFKDGQPASAQFKSVGHVARHQTPHAARQLRGPGAKVAQLIGHLLSSAVSNIAWPCQGLASDHANAKSADAANAGLEPLSGVALGHDTCAACVTGLCGTAAQFLGLCHGSAAVLGVLRFWNEPLSDALRFLAACFKSGAIGHPQAAGAAGAAATAGTAARGTAAVTGADCAAAKAPAHITAAVADCSVCCQHVEALWTAILNAIGSLGAADNAAGMGPGAFMALALYLPV